MSLPGDEFTKAVFCRDLRQLQEATHKFLAIQQELENSNQSLRDQLQKKHPMQSANEVPSTHGMLQMIKQTTYVQAVKETVIILERQCLQALFDEAGGDHVHAARMAGLSLTEWQEKLALFEIR
jgi:DNA-binding NtrC family response regulator